MIVGGQWRSPLRFLSGVDQMVDAQQLLEFPLHGGDFSDDDVSGGEAFPSAHIRGKNMFSM